jgi:transcription antitermination factor NusG
MELNPVVKMAKRGRRFRIQIMMQSTLSTRHLEVREWYALRVRTRSEQAVAGVLAEKGFEWYVPCWVDTRTYSDRTKRVSVPAFPGYAFCRFDNASRFTVLNTPGVLAVLSVGGAPEPVQEEVIFALQKAFSGTKRVSLADYLHDGERVQIVDGPMAGARGLLIHPKGQHRLVISIELLQRSVSVEVDAQSVVPISGPISGTTSVAPACVPARAR